MAVLTRSIVAAVTRGSRLMTRETVFFETLARTATSVIVARRRDGTHRVSLF
jgi:hypothetical protein